MDFQRAPSADFGCEHPLKIARQKLYDSLELSNLTVHSIDPRGLENVERPGIGARHGLDMPGPRNGPAVRLQQLTGARNDMLRTHESLRILPAAHGRQGDREHERTGGDDCGDLPRERASCLIPARPGGKG